jgi:hypothetical protein
MEHSTVVEAGAFFFNNKKEGNFFFENFPNVFAMIPCNSGLWPLTKI